eukprot:TRINITY_DN16357_c0_g2_i1.p1 TRINITY_DN16357_c0_g2~~TRINITY_DN16357_c0_g2_i1.p1  ORF type:complete len:684 (+),score=106.37 TRINITY_DN16357_c0_g2_i1:62-2113(+)
MGALVGKEATLPTRTEAIVLAKRFRQEKQAVVQEFQSFRSAFLLAYGDAISKSLCQVFVPDVHLEPTALGYPQQKRFLAAMKRLLCKHADLQVLPALHGTRAKNLKSILGQGLVIPGHGNTMPVQHGTHHGHGIYTASLHASWLSARFCDKPRMLVCAVLQTKAVLHAADAQVVRDRDHVIPLFVASGKRFDRCKIRTHSRRCTSFEELATPAVNVSWLAQLEHVVHRKQQGEPAASLRRTGCALGPLLLAGFDSLELLSCGFKQEDFTDVLHVCSLTQLKRVTCPTHLVACRDDTVKGTWSFGKRRVERICSVLELREAGFTAIDLFHAGCTAEQLQKAGFSDVEVQRATGGHLSRSIATNILSDLPLSELWELNIPLCSLLSAGRVASDLISAGFATADLFAAGCSVADMKNAGCTVHELLRLQRQTRRWRWFTMYDAAQVFKSAGYGLHELRAAGFRPYHLKSSGFDAGILRACGFHLSDLTIAFTAAELEASGISLTDLREAGVGSWLLKLAGYSSKSVAEAGYSLQNLTCAGYSNEQLESARCRTATASSENVAASGEEEEEEDEEDSCSKYSVCYDDVDLNDPLEWSLVDMWLTKESKEASRSKAAGKAARRRKLAVLKQRRQFRFKEEPPCPQRKTLTERSHWVVQKEIESLRPDPDGDILGTAWQRNLTTSSSLV